VIVATESGLAARQVDWIGGAPVAESIVASNPSIIYLGVSLAKQLGVGSDQGNDSLWVGGQRLTVAGIVRDAGDYSVASSSLIVGPDLALRLDIRPEHQTVLFRVQDNAAASVSAYLPRILQPTDPGDVSVAAEGSPQELIGAIDTATTQLIVIVALVVAVTGAFATVNSMQVAVWERRREIGILRALGVRRWSICMQFIAEAGVMSAAGGTVGFLIGTIGTAAATAASSWEFHLPPITLVVPVGALVVGILSGLVPAIRAARVDPIIMIRAD
jgi:putative ABC transport system permease protein